MKKGSIIIASLIIPIVVMLYIQTYSLPIPRTSNIPGPAYLPRVYIVLAIMLSIIVIFNAIKEKNPKEVKWDKIGYVFKGFLLMIAYIFLLTILGYFLATLLFIVALGFLLGGSKMEIFTTSAVFLLFTYSLFLKFFNLPLPKGILF